MHPLPLRTPSLVLRHFVPEDAPLVMSLNCEETTRRWLPSHVYSDLAQAAASVAYLIHCYSSPGDARLGPYVLGVEHSETARLLGHVGFSPLAGEVEVSYAIAEGARGRGYATEALAEACIWASGAFALRRLIAVTASANLPSRRTLDHAGFVHSCDEVVRFQGSEQSVSRYVWSPGATSAPGPSAA
jgi:RimJ/RimL family protein N-acetyltransferase